MSQRLRFRQVKRAEKLSKTCDKMEDISITSSGKRFFGKKQVRCLTKITYNLFEKFDLIRPKTQILPLERKAFISLKKKKKKTRN